MHVPNPCRGIRLLNFRLISFQLAVSITLFGSFGAFLEAEALEVEDYYDSVGSGLSGRELYDALSNLITESHTHQLSYSHLKYVLAKTDAVLYGGNAVVLIYGEHDNPDKDVTNDFSRAANMHGGTVGRWNKEHVFPKARGVPNLGTSGPGSDAHHLRPSDYSQNGSRDRRVFVDGSGPAHKVGSDGWYPGDRWRGDVARMVFYMNLRYGDQCDPYYVTFTGKRSKSHGELSMPAFLLKWHEEDTPDELEIQRNNILADQTIGQGNRNPFIDRPEYARQIWKASSEN